jgi:hypothetical protein
VLIVNKQLTQRFFHGRDPVGERLSINSSGEPLEGRIVGVVSDVRHGGPTDDLEPTIYVPYLQSPTPRMTILIRCPNGPEAVAYALRHGVQALDRGLPAPEVRNLETLYSDAMAAPRLRALVLGLLGVLALSLAALGIYGAVAYSTAIRRHEIGVRMALGAQRREILLMVLRYGAGLCAWGVLGGVVLGFAASRLLTNYLYGVSVMDISAWVVIAGLLIGIGVMASLRPATSAVYLEPIGALKSE